MNDASRPGEHTAAVCCLVVCLSLLSVDFSRVWVLCGLLVPLSFVIFSAGSRVLRVGGDMPPTPEALASIPGGCKVVRAVEKALFCPPTG